MKHLLLFLSFFACFTFIQAQDLIAVQGVSPTKFFSFTQLDSALVYAQDGDTLYLPGRTINLNYGNGIAGFPNKKIHFIGVGINLTTVSPLSVTKIVSCWGVTLKSGSSIAGVDLNGMWGCANVNFSGIYFHRCILPYINNSYTGDSCVLKECIGAWATFNNSVFENCILASGAYTNMSITTQNSLIKNCIITDLYWGYPNINNCLVENSIFLADSSVLYSPPITNSIVTNCMTNMDWAAIPLNNSNTLTNNLTNISAGSMFVNLQNPSNPNIFDFTNDWHLPTGSPGIGAGTNGTDIGIYGGNQPFKENMIPAYPHISNLNIPTTTGPNGNITIDITVEAQNN